MLKNIKNVKGIIPLEKSKQATIQGGARPPCYDAPQSDVNCISPWVYFPSCGWICKIGVTP
ncbi:hypothetical protein [Kordia sp.]|uniref:hypothetical protein n=1 Tax=Kordia sp. TaxID=1965332 RepID=UPI003D2A597B